MYTDKKNRFSHSRGVGMHSSFFSVLYDDQRREKKLLTSNIGDDNVDRRKKIFIISYVTKCA